MNLTEFLARVDHRIDAAVSRAEFDSEQRELLQATVTQYRDISRANPVFDPLSRATIYFIVRAWGREIDEQVEFLATFTALYLLSADLIDDVEDQDLAGKPHERVGPAIATNDGVALLFLGLDALQSAIELETCDQRRIAFQRVFNRASVVAVAGQHRDLTRKRGVLSPRDVLRMHQAKTSSLSMITECAALLAGQDGAQRERYRRIGECMALLVQVRDDVRDLFGTETCPDLALGRSTYPVACFLESAEVSEIREFAQLVRALPTTLRDVRRLLYERGAIANSAEKMEEFRQEIHENVAAANNHSAAHRCLLWIVDGLAESIYRTSPVDVSKHILEPRGPWHDLVREQFDRTFSRLAGTKVATLPSLRPWHMPQWMFVPAQLTIYYPDIEGLPEEVLPLQGRLLGSADLNHVAEIMRMQVPAVLTHEIFHFMRHNAGRMTSDYWHEEWAANRLAVAYLQRFEPDELRKALDFVEQILSHHSALIDERAALLLRDAHLCRVNAPPGYGMDVTSMTIVGLEMVRRLAATPIDWDAALTGLLAAPTGPARGVAA